MHDRGLLLIDPIWPWRQGTAFHTHLLRLQTQGV